MSEGTRPPLVRHPKPEESGFEVGSKPRLPPSLPSPFVAGSGTQGANTHMIKNLRSVMLLSAALTLGSAAMATPATAADSPIVAYNGVCGSGYNVVNHANIGNKGTVFLTYNSSNGNNCAVTVRKGTGSAIQMVVGLKRTSDSPSQAVQDEGNYTSYAGPVYRQAAGQ